MNVGFTSFDVLNTSVIDETKECLLFEVSTPKCGHPPTTIKNAAGEVIGEYEPKFPKAKITLNGYTTALSEWLPKKNPMATERILTLPNGKVYIWKQKWTGSFKLFPIDAPKDAEPVVETHNAQLRLFKVKRYGGMCVDLDLMPFLDAILLSFIVCERECQDRATGIATT
ncbi:hypothetical protein L226DRAFT_534146 [Lentinus tigrinus ALCF2SS1-7]|uniref:uncharacterized protein n=1 Tax=Lentinus tigrinus ALCF2SS1-7 TaxID=1328758 RepID=UPI0011662237|nr:hypothetical protein L226DRAFT_534146 [Lentinus tigrinus ALCF2SS1-7]